MNWLTDKLKALAGAIGELSPGCRRAVRLQSEALDHPLTLRQRVGLRVHLWLCRWCRRYGQHLAFLRAAARHDAPEASLPGPGLSPEACERIQHRLRAEQD